MKKYLFIDESGDPGSNTGAGASKNFVMVAILFDDALEMETISTEIKKLSRKLFKDDYHEFHFVNERNIHRENFIKTVSDFNFKIITSIIKKDKNESDNGNIYYETLKNICNKIGNSGDDHVFKFDGKVSKSYKFAVEKELRNMCKNKINISKVKFVNSKNDSLIQLADMCAGIIRRKHESGTILDLKLFEHIKDKII